MKTIQIFAWTTVAGRAIFQIFLSATLPNMANIAITDQSASFGETSIAIDIFGQYSESELFRVEFRCPGPGLVVITPGG